MVGIEPIATAPYHDDVAPGTDGIGGEEAAHLGGVVAGAVVVEAGFGVEPTAGETVGIADQTVVVDIGGHAGAEGVVVVALDRIDPVQYFGFTTVWGNSRIALTIGYLMG